MIDLMETAKNLKKKIIPNKKKGQKKNEESDESWKCDQCDESFSSNRAKRKHERYFHLVLKPYVCECGQQFGKLSEVNYHFRRVHQKERNFICQFCSKGFFKNSDLVSHLSIHGSSGKFMCKDCGRRFRHVSNLIRHSRTHTGVKPYPCSICNKRFSQIAALRQHQGTEEHKTKLSELMKNEKAERDELQENEIAKKKWWFYCKVCGERFQYSVLLRDHEIKHVLNKDVKCNLCMETFSHVSELNNHACSASVKEGPKLEEADVPEARTNDNDALEQKVFDVDFNPPSNLIKNDDDNNKTDEHSQERDKKVELTLSQNGQIMLDNDEVLLTLNDKVYGLLLINNDVTILENDKYLQVLNNKPQDLFTEIVDGSGKPIEIENVFSIDNQVLEGEISEASVDESRINAVESWLWNHKTLECQNENETSDQIFETSQTQTEEIVVAEESCPEEKNVKNLTTYTCSECGKEFNKKGNYQQHLGIHFITLQKHKCPECQLFFAWKSTLRKHIDKFHGEKTNYACEQCGKTYHSSILVQHHIKRDHMNIRSHKCTICGKSFFRRYDLKIHERIHTDERPYICGVCGKRFRHLSHSIRHDKTHLRKSNDKEEKVNGVAFELCL